MAQQNGIDLKVYLGNDGAGEKVYLDFEKVPHLLAFGGVGAGKTEALCRIIDELARHNAPKAVRFLLIDPKMVDFEDFLDDLHLFAPIARKPYDCKRALETAHDLMTARLAGKAPKDTHLFVVVDELADLLLGDASGENLEIITAIVQGEAGANVHFLAATQVVGGSVVKKIPYDLFSSRLIGRMYDKKDSKRYLGDDEATQLPGCSGEMILLTSTERTRLHVLRAEIWKKQN